MINDGTISGAVDEEIVGGGAAHDGADDGSSEINSSNNNPNTFNQISQIVENDYY